MLVKINNDTSYILAFNKLILALKVFAKFKRYPALGEEWKMFVSWKLSSVEREARVPAAVKREGKKTAAKHGIVNKLGMDKWEINY